MTEDLGRYSPVVAVNVLDELVRGSEPSAQNVLRAAIALALHGADRPEAAAALCDLEQLVLAGQKLDAVALERAARVASALRHVVGIH